MSRYPAIQPQPPQPTLEGDDQFIGIQMKLDRDKLRPGYLSRAENNRLKRGVCEPRPGTITPTYANVVPMQIHGSGLYSNPNGEEVILIANGNPSPAEVLVIKSGSYPASVALPAGFSFDPDFPLVEFSQHFDKLLLHQLNGLPTLVWDGASPAFVPITKSDPFDTSTALMPNPPWSVNFGDRAIFPIPDHPDQIGVSDILDYTSYDPILSVFRINRGTADTIVGVYPFPTNNLIVGKDHGIDVLTGFVGDLSNAAMEVISTEIGMCGRRTPKMVGADMFFLCKDHQAVYRINQVIQFRLQAEPIPVSDSIEPMMKRINWSAAHLAVGAVQDIYYILAVPIDGSPVNNAILAHNTVTGEWESAPGYWAAPNFQLDNLIHSFYFGEAALYCINHGMQAIHVLGINETEDEMPNNIAAGSRIIYEIQHLLETRGYATLGWNASSRRDVKQLKIAVATLRPSLTVTELLDGAKDERPLTSKPITKNPLKYRNFDKPDFNPSNDNNDFEAPGREDYSLDVSTTDFNCQVGVELDLRQREVLPFSTKARGRYVSYRIQNTTGKCAVSGILTDSTGTQRNEPRRAA